MTLAESGVYIIILDTPTYRGEQRSKGDEMEFLSSIDCTMAGGEGGVTGEQIDECHRCGKSRHSSCAASQMRYRRPK